MKIKNLIGKNLKRIRHEMGLTQEELASKSGLSQGYINQLESGKRRYTQKSLELIANALSVPVAEFLKDEGARDELPMVAEKPKRYKKKTLDRKEFMAILKELPDHVAEHYFTLLRLEKKLWKK